ncbi:MAG TPA: phosphatase PAP2 family protein [Mycobacteriales bacterium]|nr:phosphatase PAP2 family protein [Mycobacteriales bacterium]
MTGDRHDFNVVRHFANSTSWLHGFMEFMAKYGIVFLAIALLVGWWIGRRDDSPRKVAIAVWSALAALVALVLVQPIANAATEQRPFVNHPEVHKLIAHSADFGFPSDHATGAGAIAAGLLFLSWRLGLVTALVAVLIAFSRVYVGVHFPQDVLAGLALGAAVAVLGIFIVVPLLTRLLERLTRTPVRPLITSGRAEPAL